MDQAIAIAKKPINETLSIPGSKTLTERAIILAALADGMSEITNIRMDEDIDTLINALRQLGVIIQADEATKSCIIAGSGGKLPKPQSTVWCGSSISTLCQLLVACSASPCVYYFDSTPFLRKYSIKQILRVLNRQGVQIIPGDQEHLPFTLLGSDGFAGGDLVIDDEMPSEAASALIISAAFARMPFTFMLNNTSQQPLIDMTCSLMADFGVLTHRLHQGQLTIPVPQRYTGTNYTIEPDLSIAGYLFAAAALTNGSITITGQVQETTHQPQQKMLLILEKMGCNVTRQNTNISVTGTNMLNGIDISLKTFASSFLTVCAIAPFAKSPSRISRIGKISTQESELIQIVKNELNKLNIDVESGHDWIKVFPGKPQAGTIDCHRDYRMAMAFALIGLKVPNIVVQHAEQVENYWPEYFETLNNITTHANVDA